MPLANSYNALAFNNQQPEYQCLWATLGISQASAITAITYPTAAGAGAWVPGALVSIIAAGVGTNPGPAGDNDGATGYTVAQLDIAAVSATTFLAGVILGFAALGDRLVAAPNTFSASQAGPNLTCMVGTKGICQVLCDNTTTVGHTLIVSATATHTGQASDSGGTAFTLGSTIGVALQAVTVSTGPKLVWAKIDVPFSI
jgi:hypothetical protein